MNGFYLLFPFLAVRFGLLALINKKAIKRAGSFSPMQGREKIAYYIYQLANTGLFLYLLVTTVKTDFSFYFYSCGQRAKRTCLHVHLATAARVKYPVACCGIFDLGLVCYFSGILLCAISIVCFASPDVEGLNTNGIYQFSRNPMYIAYFICFIGMSFLTQSLLLFGIVIIFQVSAHWIILSEERWCIEKFGKSYSEYMKKVRRYL